MRIIETLPEGCLCVGPECLVRTSVSWLLKAIRIQCPPLLPLKTICSPNIDGWYYLIILLDNILVLALGSNRLGSAPS
jgi:hypothetical protein